VDEIRCPFGSLFAMVSFEGDMKLVADANNLIEVACPKCRKAARSRQEGIEQVLHRFDLTGRLVETILRCEDSLHDEVWPGSAWTDADVTIELRSLKERRDHSQ